MKKCGKKLIGLLMAAAMVSTMALSGCKEKAPETTAAETKAQTEAEQNTPEAAGTESAGGESQAQADGKDPNRLIKIGFLFSNVISTDAWAQTHENARLYLEENCENVETFKVENIAGGADCERVMREYINDGCEIIVGTSFDYLDYMLALADEYPDIAFINGSGYETKDNLSVYIAKLEQGRYLTGMMAGELTEADKIGYCSSIPFPDPIKQLNGFAAGVAATNPDAKVVTLWSNSFNDPTTDALCANTLIDQGCDLICIDLSSSAVAQVCEERGVKFIGSSVDMREFAPTQQLTSNCWTWGPWMAKQVEAVREGNFKGAWCELDINDGAISLADYSDAVPQNVIDMIEEQKQKFMDGEEVFVGPLYDNTGKLRVPEGESLTGEAANSMQWFLPNVIDNWADKPVD